MPNEKEIRIGQLANAAAERLALWRRACVISV
jgi:hypothetical protein